MIKAALIGAGNRGMNAYGDYALKRPHDIQIVAVAEPDEKRRLHFAGLHGIPEERQFAGWREMLDHPKLCEALLICSQDRMHYEPAMQALRQGYHILLEKPMSPDPKEALRMAVEADRRQQILMVCHVSRYSPFFIAVKEIIESGSIGDIAAVQWTENVGYWHHAHSFVRGNWRNTAETSPMLLQKCCHDMDLLQWLIGTDCEEVSSYGSLSHFTADQAPEGSTLRCTDGCKVEHECLYSAIKWYYNDKDDFPQNVVALDRNKEARMQAILSGPYGRCVYHCDNDVVDHQMVGMKFGGNVTVAFTMSAFSKDVCRNFKIMGTKAELNASTMANEIEIRRFNGRSETIHPELVEGVKGGHGGDEKIMMEFIRRVQGNDNSNIRTSAMVSASSHLIVFAAEHSRLTRENVTMSEYVKQLQNEIEGGSE